MIIVYLTGGLGNQMFQYATARRLAEKHSTILKLDVNGFETYKLHRYSLHCFNIWEYLATRTEIQECLALPKLNKFEKVISRLGVKKIAPLVSPNVWKEKHFHFDPEILEAPNNIYLEGYWQSAKYFQDIRPILLREFSFKYPQDAKSQDINQTINNTNSISIHIRRADYVTNSQTYQIHGACSLDYYQKCVNDITSKVEYPYFFIFSDDPSWAKENLNLSFPTVLVDHNDASKNYEDLRLMSQCKHNIIANSSFSWWAAWLNSNPDKIVYAPQRWFNDDSINYADVYCENWQKI